MIDKREFQHVLREEFADAVVHRIAVIEGVRDHEASASSVCPFVERHHEAYNDEGHFDPDHTAITWGGLWYDAECLEGVGSAAELPIYKNQGRSRTEVTGYCPPRP